MGSVLLPILFTLTTVLPNISRGAEPEATERDIEAMEAIIVDFCQTKQLCDGKKHGQLTIFAFQETETAKLLSDIERKTIKSCIEKFEIRMTKQGVKTLYIYCFDNEHPKLEIEKDITRDSELR